MIVVVVRRLRSVEPSDVLYRPPVALGIGADPGRSDRQSVDRIFRGTVTDFLEIYQGTWTFPAFNVADSAITVGAALLLFDLLRPKHQLVHE